MADRKISKIKRVFDEILKKKGYVTPQDMVEVSKPSNALLHPYFEWDNEVAGHEYRLWQAREMVRDLKCEFEGKQIHYCQNVVVKISGKSQRAYVTTVETLSKKELREQVLAYALRQLNYWVNQHKIYNELVGLVDTKKLKQLIRTLKSK